jgi:hypothetical protein
MPKIEILSEWPAYLLFLTSGGCNVPCYNGFITVLTK